MHMNYLVNGSQSKTVCHRMPECHWSLWQKQSRENETAPASANFWMSQSASQQMDFISMGWDWGGSLKPGHASLQLGIPPILGGLVSTEKQIPSFPRGIPDSNAPTNTCCSPHTGKMLQRWFQPQKWQGSNENLWQFLTIFYLWVNPMAKSFGYNKANPQTGTVWKRKYTIKPTLLVNFLFQPVWMEIGLLKNGRERVQRRPQRRSQGWSPSALGEERERSREISEPLPGPIGDL